MKRIDTEKSRYWNIAIYGDSGTGKTTLGTTAPKPLFLLSERQGVEHIREAVDASGCDMPPVLFMETKADYFNVLKALKGDKAKPFSVKQQLDSGTYETVIEIDSWPETIVIDSLTDALNIVKAELLREAPPEVQSDGLAEMQMRHWGALRDRCAGFIRAFRDVAANVVFLCLKKEKDGDVKVTRSVGPELPIASLPPILMAATNLCVMALREEVVKRDKEGKPVIKNGNPVKVHEFKVLTRGPRHMMAKTPRSLRSEEVPDIKTWINKLEIAQE